MRYFFTYLKDKSKKLIPFLIFFSIFFISFLLYNIDLRAVIYPFFVCIFLYIVYIALFDFRRSKRRHDTLMFISENINALPDALIKPQNCCEDDLVNVINSLLEEIKTIKTEYDESLNDTIEYYTVWAHQIKTPISAMRLTLQNEDSELSRKLMLDLLHIDQYADMVMTYLRTTDGANDYVIKEFDLENVTREAAKKFSGEFIARKLRLIYDVPQGIRVLSDEKWLMFVIEQVLSNALKYTKEGYIKISVEDPLTLAISDTGIGISKSDLPRIFEKGYTGYNGRTDKKASGIGLYLCARIMKNLGHRISAESNEHGTSIKLDLYREKSF